MDSRAEHQGVCILGAGVVVWDGGVGWGGGKDGDGWGGMVGLEGRQDWKVLEGYITKLSHRC